MHPLLSRLQAADYAFLVGIIESPFNATDDQALRLRRDRYEEDPSSANQEALVRELENAIQYLGSSDVAFLFRRLQGREPGVSFQEIIRDVAGALKVTLTTMATDEEMLAHLVETYVTREFSKLPPEEQQALLESLGVEQERAAAFVKKSAGVFALPLLIQAFGSLVVDGLIKRVIFGAIGAIIGKQLAMRLFDFIAKRFPWWVSWIGPAAWTLSLGWTALDITGPALRKTIPIVLYLGICQLRGRESPSPA